VAQMLERENFTNRFAANQPIGLQEFLYPLMQGYDSVALKADVELGGTEQLFNLLAGRTLQRAFGQVPQAVITCTLLLGLDGRKMSKSFGNTIALTDPAKDMYGKVMRFSDDQIISCFELCTEVPLEEIDAISDALDDGSNPMLLKKRLAFEITRLYHTDAQSRHAQEAFEREIQRKELPHEIQGVELERGGEWTIADLLVNIGLARSKSEARQKAREGAVYIDGARATELLTAITVHTGMTIKLGRNYRRLVVRV
jgi:tyrosyl-tRNA synthetase